MEKRRAKIKSFDEDQEFPGYLKYAPSEDIMNKGKRIEGNLDDETLGQVKSSPSRILPPIERIDMPEGVEDKLILKNNEEGTANEDRDKKIA